VGLGKQAKTLTKAQVEAVLGYLSNTRHPVQNRLILLLSIKAGLRAKEWVIAHTSCTRRNQRYGMFLAEELSQGRAGGR